MAEPRVQVRNAADRVQVGRADRRDKRREARVDDLHRAQLRTYEGREFVYDLLERAGVYRSIWHPSAEIHYMSGRQDFGHQLRDRCLYADEDAFYLMEREARARVKRDNQETDASQIKRAEESNDERDT